jgi:hypothetical protein
MSKVIIEIPNGNLDLEKNVSFGLNYTIDDIKKLEVKNTNYSKTIVLAGSKNNNKLLGGLFDINADFTFFNPHIKTPARILEDGVVVMDGYLQLTSIDIVKANDRVGDYVNYSCKVTSATTQIMNDLGSKKLSDLNFNHLSHIYGKAAIENSWANDYTKTYVYPMLFNNSNNYNTSDFKPAIFYKAYLLKIFEEAGYKIKGSILDDNTDEGSSFSKEIIPFGGDIPTIPQAEYERRRFKVGIPNGANLSIDVSNNISGFTNENSIDGYFDNGNNFDGSKWTVDKNGNYKIGFNLTGNINFTTPIAVNQYNVRLSPFGWAGVYDSFNQDTSETGFLQLQVYVNGVHVHSSSKSTYTTPNSFSGTQSTAFSFVGFAPNRNLRIGDEITFKIFKRDDTLSGGHEIIYSSTPLNGITHNPTPVSLVIDYDFNDTGFVYNDCNATALTDGDTIFLESFIPKDYKQTDLLKDIIKRYNVYISVNPNDEYELILDTRDSFYSKGVILDWTDKKDFSKKDTTKLISEVQNKELNFTYIKGEDSYNKNYTESTEGDIYGQKKISFDNEFTKGTNKIETSFCPSPLIYNSQNPVAIVSAIPTNENLKGMRVLYYNGMKNCLNGGSWTYTYINAGVTGVSAKTSYPYAGHLDDPLSPDFDLNFGQIPYSYYNENQTTTNGNLYNRYWSNYVNQINSGKIVTMSFYLNGIDINFIKDNLNAKIYVKDSYYYINKIKDYDCTKESLTKVELLKIVDGISFVGETQPANIKNTGSNNNDDSLLKINNNNDNSENSIVKGKNNSIGNDSNNSLIIGNNNTIESGLQNVYIIGTDNVTITESNTGYINGVYYKNGIIENDFNLLYSDIIALRNSNNLVKDGRYYATDKAVTFTAINSGLLSFNGTRVMRVVKSNLYNTLGIWKESEFLNVGDKRIYGGRVWTTHTTGSTGAAPTNFDLDSSFYEIDLGKSNYEDKVFDVVFSEATGSVTETRDGRGNVVISVLNDYHVNSDWNDLRISNNITTGFVNNDWGAIQNNNCNLLAFNTSFDLGVMEHNNITGDIVSNKASQFRTLEIKYNSNKGDISYNDAQDNMNILRNNNNGNINNNRAINDLDILDNNNNGFISYNSALLGISINDNINNGDIGNSSSFINRVSNITDSIINK